MGSQARTPAVEPAVLAVISVGGGIGAVMRYLVGLRWPSQPDQVPWATFAVNVVGCFSIGILMVLITEVWVAHRLLRPFLGVGLLGGFTTFSTYSVEIRRLLESGAAIEAFGYLGGTVAASLGAVWLGMGVARLSAGTTRPRRRGGRQ
ncbi:CrcB protein [Nocardia amikacinitolerans]|uniref:Fluoride-specific ion channel FluC n=2 Tax=Nocardia amikacinitolerans TaxID=756689 RepID=A0A285L7F8_9NOCA|nr:CrcB protein [Nocardia amikacinitolerans]MCP2289852.1 CrcB protein [Nocardia amikacinitolerans]MCP2297035.1 CrcB protein [Nocardia amikacinitolerans]SNY80393.1 CrcB protein [Nocardia amikacinitolerans]